MAPRVAITIYDMGYDFSREISIMDSLGMKADFVPLEGTDDEAEIISRMHGFDYVLAGPERWSASVFNALRGGLKMVARLGVGIDSVDVEGATAAGVAVSNAPGGNACSVAQHTIGLMLALARNLAGYDAAVRSGQTVPRMIAKDLMNATVGLIGFGNVAQMTAKLLSGFDCEILAYDAFQNADAAKSLGVRFVPLDELAARSDFVSIHVPLLEHTRGMIDANFLGKMKNSAYLVNTSRGEVVKESDLAKALREGIIAGAGLDVCDTPMYDSCNPFRGLYNTVLTPYVAYSGELGNKKTADMAIESINEHYTGQPVSRLLNPEYIQNLPCCGD